jgi:hypothetical protein
MNSNETSSPIPAATTNTSTTTRRALTPFLPLTNHVTGMERGGNRWRMLWHMIKLFLAAVLDQDPLRLYTHFTLPLLTWITVRNFNRTKYLAHRVSLSITAL